MEALVYFAIWGVVIFLMMRMGCGRHVMGHSRGHGQSSDQKQHDNEAEGRQGLKWYPPEEDIDPVCKKKVRTDDAKPSVYDGYVYYFCSRECRELFEVKPDLYIGGGDDDASNPRLETNNA